MDFQGLPKDSRLYNLLLSCQVSHELILREALDGALILECVDCPFHHVLSGVEEVYLRDNNPIFQDEKNAL